MLATCIYVLLLFVCSFIWHAQFSHLKWLNMQEICKDEAQIYDIHYHSCLCIFAEQINLNNYIIIAKYVCVTVILLVHICACLCWRWNVFFGCCPQLIHSTTQNQTNLIIFFRYTEHSILNVNEYRELLFSFSLHHGAFFRLIDWNGKNNAHH